MEPMPVRGRSLFLLAILFMFGGEAMAFRIESPAFQDKGKIPKKHTCDGGDLSPPLVWMEPPARTKSFSLIADDPDAPVGTWVHWVLYDLPLETQGLAEGISKSGSLPSGAKQGMTDFSRADYGGPCPPPGPSHRYLFKLYALDTVLNLPPKATKADLLIAMNGHVLAQADLVGTYQRS